MNWYAATVNAIVLDSRNVAENLSWTVQVMVHEGMGITCTLPSIQANKGWLYVLLEYGCIMRLTMAENLLHNCCLKVPRHGCGKQGQAWCICTFLTIQVTKYRFTCAA